MTALYLRPRPKQAAACYGSHIFLSALSFHNFSLSNGHLTADPVGILHGTLEV